MSWENDLSTAGIITAEIAGEAAMTLASGGAASTGTIVTSILGAVVGEGVPGVLGAFGLGNSGSSGSSPDEAAYAKAIESQLSDVESTLVQSLSDIQMSVNWLKAQATNIEQAIAGSELQLLLVNYNNNVSTVESNMQQYADAIAALSPGADNSSTSLAMYNLLSNNAGAVDIAMRNIFDSVNGVGEQQGILDFQVQICQQAVTTWANNSQNLLLSNPGSNQDTSGYTGAYDNSLLITAPFATVIPGAIATSVVPTYQAILAAMGKGLLFLGAAWQNTDNDGMLQLHINHIQTVMQAMNQFWTQLTDPTQVNKLAITLMNSYKQSVGDLGNNVTNVNDSSQQPGPQPFPVDWAWWAVPGQGSGDVGWANINSGVADIPATVTELGGTVSAYNVGVGWGEGSWRIPGVVCAPTSVTIPTPASTIPTSMPPALLNFVNALGSVSPGIFVATGGTVQELTCAWAGEPATSVTWSIEPSDGSAGTVTAGTGNAATYTAPSSVTSASLASIQVEINGSIPASAWIVLLPQQPNVLITPSFANPVQPSAEVTFTTSGPSADFMGALWSAEGQGPFNGNPAFGTITGLVYTAPAALSEPGTVIVTFDAPSVGQYGYALIELVTGS